MLKQLLDYLMDNQQIAMMVSAFLSWVLWLFWSIRQRRRINKEVDYWMGQHTCQFNLTAAANKELRDVAHNNKQTLEYKNSEIAALKSKVSSLQTANHDAAELRELIKQKAQRNTKLAHAVNMMWDMTGFTPQKHQEYMVELMLLGKELEPNMTYTDFCAMVRKL